jgi:hypothetical protein
MSGPKTELLFCERARRFGVGARASRGYELCCRLELAPALKNVEVNPSIDGQELPLKFILGSTGALACHHMKDAVHGCRGAKQASDCLQVR